MARPVNMLYLGAIESNDIRQRPQQIARLLAKFYRLTYLEPVGLRSLQLKDYERLRLRLKSVLRHRRVHPALEFDTASLFYIPFAGSRMFRSINERILLAQARRRFAFLGSGDFFLWIGSPNLLARTLLKKSWPYVSIYDCMDDLAAIHEGPDSRRIVEDEDEVARSVDIVFASSLKLYEKMVQRNSRTFLVQNGVDLNCFNLKNAPDRGTPTELPSGKPLVGYYGTIGHWVDLELVDYVAASRPEWNVILIGPLKTLNSRLPQRKNIFWIGPKPYDRIVSYAKRFSVAMIPFLINELTKSVNPVKLYEYLALGKAVVSTNLPEVQEFSALIRVAKSRDEFLRCLDEEVRQEPDPAIMRQRFEAVNKHSWDRRIEEIRSIIESFERD